MKKFYILNVSGVDFIFTQNDILKAHKCSISNREKLQKDNICGCFDCLKIFNPDEILQWVDEESVTAICPYCSNDTIIGASSGYPINHQFLLQVKNHWCPDETE